LREIFKMAVILAFISVVAASALSNVYLVTRDKIAAVEAGREAEARRAALPVAGWFEKDSSAALLYYRAYSDSISRQLIGYVVPAEGHGYSSNIRTMVGVDTLLQLTGIKIAAQQETPGLGTRVEEVKSGAKTPWFQDQFKGKTIEQLQVVRGKDPSRIEAITGATISSRAVTNSVRAAVEQLQSKIKQP